ncbi:MAG: hypothetical protein ACJA0H_002497 [Francisellaceae bacterium]
MQFKIVFFYFTLLAGFFLLMVNSYGLNQNIRVNDFDNQYLRFLNDQPAEQFNQLIPIWENYFIYFMGVFSGIPEYERYHFANYQRSLERGIGLCGDASMVISQLLDKQNISNKILTLGWRTTFYHQKILL